MGKRRSKIKLLKEIIAYLKKEGQATTNTLAYDLKIQRVIVLESLDFLKEIKIVKEKEHRQGRRISRVFSLNK